MTEAYEVWELSALGLDSSRLTNKADLCYCASAEQHDWRASIQATTPESSPSQANQRWYLTGVGSYIAWTENYVCL